MNRRDNGSRNRGRLTSGDKVKIECVITVEDQDIL